MHIFGSDYSAWQVVVLVLAAFFTGFSKTGIIGLGIVLTPLLASGFPAGVALGFTVPISLLGDVWTIANYRHKVVVRPLLKALPFGVAGTLAGWLAASALAAAYGAAADGKLRVLIGVLMAVVVGLGFYVSRHPQVAMAKKTDGGTPLVRTWYAALAGTFAGGVSMLTNSGGPIWGVYFSSLGLEVKEIIGTVVWCYAIVALVKLPLSANLGFLNRETLLLNLALAPLTIAGVYAGPVLSKHFGKNTFGSIVRVLALIGALYMIFC